MRRWSFVILALMIGCKMPASPPTAPPEPPPPTAPPRVDAPFSWEAGAVFSSFAMRDRSEAEIRTLYSTFASYGYRTARVCAETEFWDGDLPTIPRDENALEAFLDHVARIPGAQVLLMGNCTLKGPVSFEEQDSWNTRVVEIAKGYQNVAIEVENEYWSCRGRGWGPYCADEVRVTKWIREAQAVGIQAGADDNFCGGGRFRHSLANIVSFASFHPCREDEQGRPWDPLEGTLQRLASANPYPLVLSETVAYDESISGGLYTPDRRRIEEYLRRCKNTPGCVWTYHYTGGLMSDLPSWVPTW